jgi:hypothetical protein
VINDLSKLELPDPLALPGKNRIKTPNEWFTLNRPIIKEYFQREIYGRVPIGKFETRSVVRKTIKNALRGKATLKEVRLIFKNNYLEKYIDVLIYLPNSPSEHPVPLFLGLNFCGNHTILSDPNITLSEKWISTQMCVGAVDQKASEHSRGSHAKRWLVQQIIETGFGLATVYYGDLYPDHPQGYRDSIQALFASESKDSDQWGAIATWSWGLQKVMDYFEDDQNIDQHRIILFGHSRLGKAALLAGALDDRFSIVISNNSGCMGAALSRRRVGETIGLIHRFYPYWFCKNFERYIDQESNMLVDQHMLISLIAPRPVYVASASLDVWADPMGEFLSAKAASKVYALLGKRGLEQSDFPAVDQSILDTTIGYHIRNGEHDIKEFDWVQFIKFTKNHIT